MSDSGRKLTEEEKRAKSQTDSLKAMAVCVVIGLIIVTGYVIFQVTRAIH